MDTGIRYHDCVDTWEGLHILMKYFSLVFFISIFLFSFFFFFPKILANIQDTQKLPKEIWSFSSKLGLYTRSKGKNDCIFELAVHIKNC